MNKILDKIKPLIEKGYSITEIASELNMNRTTISKYCKQANLEPYKTIKWTDKDSELMSNLLEEHELKDIPFLMKKPFKQIMTKYNQPDIKLYNSKDITKEKEIIIIDMINKGESYNSIGEKINIGYQTVRKFCRSRNLISTNRKRWDDKDKELLKELYSSGKYTIKDIAKLMNTTIDSVKGQASIMNLSINAETSNKLLTNKEKAYIESNLNKKSVSQIANELKRSKDTIFKYCRENNLETKKQNLFDKICLKTPLYEIDIQNPALSSAFVDRKYKLTSGTTGRIRKSMFKDFKQMTDTFLCKTTTELDVEEILKELDLAFMYEYQIDKWKVDYYLGNKIIIEVQGSYWHSLERVKSKDEIKFKELKEKGYKIIEIKEEDLNKDSNKIKDLIKSVWVTHRK